MSMRRTIGLITFIMIFMLADFDSVAQHSVSFHLRSILQSEKLNEMPFHLETVRIDNEQEMRSYYESIDYCPAWNEEANVDALITCIKNAKLDGLLSEDYHLDDILSYTNQDALFPEEEAVLDILLTDAFLTYARHLWFGKSNPENLFPEKWESAKKSIDLVHLLADAVERGAVRLVLDSLRPQTVDYYRLRSELSRLYSSDEPILIPDGQDIEFGAEDSRIPLVRTRFNLPLTNGNRYDSLMYATVSQFQSTRGLAPDGIVGKKTLAALNESNQVAIGRIKSNLERYRWLPRQRTDMYVVVNIPDYMLQVFDNDSSVVAMRAIIGRPDRSTPIFSSVIRYLILNPTWTVPPTIFKEDILPAVKKSIGYLDKHSLRVIDKHGLEIEAASLDWKSFTYKNFPYQLRQDPGLFNSMGLIKFQFPNQYKVFLHDTNARYLFSQSYRALSSGCIRIERPFELALFLLRNTHWSEERLGKELSSGKTRTIVLDKPVTIHIEYFTVFADLRGELQIRDDIYGIDPVVLKAIETPMH